MVKQFEALADPGMNASPWHNDATRVAASRFLVRSSFQGLHARIGEQ